MDGQVYLNYVQIDQCPMARARGINNVFELILCFDLKNHVKVGQWEEISWGNEGLWKK